MAMLLDDYNRKLLEALGFGISPVTDIFTTSPLISDATQSVAEQKLTVNYRAAIEALSTLVNEMSRVKGFNPTTDTLLQRLALDIYSDDVIDNSANGKTIGGIDKAILARNPLDVQIVNTSHKVRDIKDLIEEEAAVVGASSNVPFYKSQIAVNLKRASGSSTETPPPSTGNKVSTPPPAPSGSNTGAVKAPAGTVLKVDFNNHRGGAYTKQDAIRDFNASAIPDGVGVNNVSIVSDPAGNTGRGKVMRVTHLANRGGGSGGFRFKANFPAADEYYLAFDMYIPTNYEVVATEKLPGLMYGTLLDASHASGKRPVAEGVKAFSVMHQLMGRDAFAGRGDAKLTSYVYDAKRVQYDEFFDLVNPKNSQAHTTWQMPKGQWVRIEQRIKQNTATSRKGVGVKADGILQQWVNGKLTVDKRKIFRTVNTMHIDGIFMYNYYGGKASDPINQPSRTQYGYFDNFIVSRSPITH
jgi:hypothetical protein